MLSETICTFRTLVLLLTPCNVSKHLKVAFITASLYSSNVHDGGKLQELSHVINIIMLESLSHNKYRERCKVSPDDTLYTVLPKERKSKRNCGRSG